MVQITFLLEGGCRRHGVGVRVRCGGAPGFGRARIGKRQTHSRVDGGRSPSLLSAIGSSDGDDRPGCLLPWASSRDDHLDNQRVCPAVQRLAGTGPGYSPSFVVVDAHGSPVWDRCWIHDEPGACFTILVARTLAPGDRFSQAAVWDQRSGTGPQDPPHQVPPGIYRFRTHYQNIARAGTVAFAILP
jgi:hypothetical protein